MGNPWGAFRARFNPITDERVKEIRSALVAYLDDKPINDGDQETLIRWKYIDGPSGMVTRMGHEFLVREEKMAQYMAKYWPSKEVA